jgi:hypothetical protein
LEEDYESFAKKLREAERITQEYIEENKNLENEKEEMVDKMERATRLIKKYQREAKKGAESSHTSGYSPICSSLLLHLL